MSYKKQVNRIKNKLHLAKEADKTFRVFGASSHQYFLKPPLSQEQISDFEKEYAVPLPECYRLFVAEVGNGGFSVQKSGAGPYFGIYPLGESLNDLVNSPKVYLSKPAIIYPEITEKAWDLFRKRIDEDDDISDEDYDIEMGRIYGGVLPLGSQGCSYIHALVLNGPHKGLVANLDRSGNKPHFSYENNFLDWYERWLNEIISGHLTNSGPVWFGYSKVGPDQDSD